jgi:DNA-directed RNA polymerase specialized sigma24 family protein
MDQDGSRAAVMTLEQEARRAIEVDRHALERLVRAIQGDIYGIALRMLCNREDAEDATQEILVRVVTRLAQFDFRSRPKNLGLSRGSELHSRREEGARRRLQP